MDTKDPMLARQLTRLANSFEANRAKDCSDERPCLPCYLGQGECRAAGRAAAEPEGFVLVPESLAKAVARNMVRLVDYLALEDEARNKDDFGGDNQTVIALSRCMDDTRASAATGVSGAQELLEFLAAPTPTASIAPNAEGEADIANWKAAYEEKLHDCLSLIEENEALRAAPVAQAAAGALEKFHQYGADEECNPIERLRAFCSFAMNGQDWIDVEPFIAALSPRPEADADRASGGGV